MRVANANNAAGAIIVRLPNKVELIGPFLCASVNSRRALSRPPVPPGLAKELLRSRRSGTVTARTSGFGAAPAHRPAAPSRKPAGSGRGPTLGMPSMGLGCCPGWPEGRDAALRQSFRARVRAGGRRGTFPARRCGFPAILLTYRDPHVIRPSGSCTLRRRLSRCSSR